MQRHLTAPLVLIFFVGQACAYFDTGSSFTSGPHAYSGLNVFCEGGNDDYYLRPSFHTYKSGGAAPYSTYSLGAGLDRPLWRGSLEISLTPETAGYKSSSAYADLIFNLISEPEEDAALTNLALGAFAELTAHEDNYSLSTDTDTTASGSDSSGRRPGRGIRNSARISSIPSEPTTDLKLRQTNFGLTTSLWLRQVRLSGRFTKTYYDKDVTEYDRQLPLYTGNIGASGFLDRAFSAMVRFPSLPLSPEAGYIRTYYLLEQADSKSVSFGLSQKIGMADLSVGWENFNPGDGTAKNDYYSVGLTLSF